MYLFIWLQQSYLQHMGSLAVACELLCCSLWDLVPWPGIKPVPPALGVQSLSCWTTREIASNSGLWMFWPRGFVGLFFFFCKNSYISSLISSYISSSEESLRAIWESVSQPQCVCWINPNSQLLGCENFSVDKTHNRFLLHSFSHNADP